VEGYLDGTLWKGITKALCSIDYRGSKGGNDDEEVVESNYPKPLWTLRRGKKPFLCQESKRFSVRVCGNVAEIRSCTSRIEFSGQEHCYSVRFEGLMTVTCRMLDGHQRC
jgi:hypothetical protein